ncbi:MAG: NADH-quinone oxidoreductase subunit L [Pseudomonadales bacterium]
MDLLWLIPVLPLLGFLALVATEGRLGERAVALVGAGSVGMAALVAVPVTAGFFEQPAGTAFTQTLWTWMDVAGFRPEFTLYLDGLSLVMLWVITGVGFLIHLYATGYMAGDPGYSRFFAYMNLFVFAMLMLVLGDHLLVLYLGWEGVGLCSYLLIGFFQQDPANGYAARKAFVVTRVGDTAMALGLLLLFRELGTLEIQPLLGAATDLWPGGSPTLTLAAFLILGGAVGKSAQLPLQTWLPDAMAGPTPVSALIHAATMVTAGVYLIARLNDLYLLAPAAQLAVALVGLATLFIAAFAALVQTDVKRILAYSTMSQIGYMFFALGVGAWSAAVFHLMTHAFFKALLFLSAGSLILALHHEQDIARMGGLWRRLPWPFAGMLVGGAALAALPFTSGYFSKDVILLTAFDAPGGFWLWAVALLAALVTALYSVRLIVVVFFGPPRWRESGHEPRDRGGIAMQLPLALLALLAVGGGWFGLSPVAGVLPDGGIGHGHGGWVVWVTSATPLVGVLLGYLLFQRWGAALARLGDHGAGAVLRRFLLGGWGFDWLYRHLVERPFVGLARLNRNDVVDRLFDGLAAAARELNGYLVATQTGNLRWYLTSMAGGLALVLLIVLGVL